jgi:ankyrin repeat protein
VPRRALSPLHWAAALGNKAAVDQLFAQGFHDRDTGVVPADDDGSAPVPPVVLAAIGGHADVALAINAKAPHANLAEYRQWIGDASLKAKLAGKQAGPTPAIKQQLPLIEPQASLDPIARAEQPLLACAFDYDVRAVEAAALSGVAARDRYGVTALHVLAARSTWRRESEERMAACVKALILRGADVNARDVNGSTPLLYAVQSANAAVARALVDGGANVNLANALGHQPLDVCQYGLASLLPGPAKLPAPATVARLSAIRDLLRQKNATVSPTTYDVPTLPPSSYLEANLARGVAFDGRKPKAVAARAVVAKKAHFKKPQKVEDEEDDEDSDGSGSRSGSDEDDETATSDDEGEATSDDGTATSDDAEAPSGFSFGGMAGGAFAGRGGAYASRGGGRGGASAGRGAYAGRGGGRGGASAGRGGMAGGAFAGRGGAYASRGGRGGFGQSGSPPQAPAMSFGTFGTPYPASGEPQQVQAQSFSFGSTSQATAAPSAFLFGSPQPTAAPDAFGSFGSPQPTAAPASFGSFGTPYHAGAAAAPPMNLWAQAVPPEISVRSAASGLVVMLGRMPFTTKLAELRALCQQRGMTDASSGSQFWFQEQCKSDSLTIGDLSRTALSVMLDLRPTVQPSRNIFHAPTSTPPLSTAVRAASSVFRAPSTPPQSTGASSFGWQPQVTPVRSYGQSAVPQPHQWQPQPQQQPQQQPLPQQPLQQQPQQLARDAVPDLTGTRTPVAKLLLLVAHLFKRGALVAGERAKLKQLVLANDATLLAVLECFEVDGDEDELLDSLKQVAK